MMMKKFFKGY